MARKKLTYEEVAEKIDKRQAVKRSRKAQGLSTILPKDAESTALQRQNVADKRMRMFGSAALEAAGFGPQILKRAVKRLSETLDAKKSIVLSSGSGDTKSEEVIEVPDQALRLRAVKETFKAADVYPRGKEASESNQREPFVIELVQQNADGSTTAVRIKGETSGGRTNAH